MKKLIAILITLSFLACEKQDGHELFRESLEPQYTHGFVVKVGDKLNGRIDSVIITINGKYFKEEIPFYYGSSNIPDSYNVRSTPNFNGTCRTQVEVKGVRIDRFTHYNGNTGVLSGSINY